MSAPGAQGSRERLVWPRSGRSGTTLCISGKNPVGLWKELIMFAKEGGGGSQEHGRPWELEGNSLACVELLLTPRGKPTAESTPRTSTTPQT